MPPSLITQSPTHPPTTHQPQTHLLTHSLTQPLMPHTTQTTHPPTHQSPTTTSHTLTLPPPPSTHQIHPTTTTLTHPLTQPPTTLSQPLTHQQATHSHKQSPTTHTHTHSLRHPHNPRHTLILLTHPPTHHYAPRHQPRRRHQPPPATHHRHGSVRHLRVPHQPQQPVSGQAERDLRSALRAFDAGDIGLVFCLPGLLGSQRQADREGRLQEHHGDLALHHGGGRTVVCSRGQSGQLPSDAFAIFVLASGVCALQTSANPYVAILGPEYERIGPAEPGAGLQLRRFGRGRVVCRHASFSPTPARSPIPPARLICWKCRTFTLPPDCWCWVL